MSIRDYDNIDLSPCPLFELVNAYMTDVQNKWSNAHDVILMS